MSISRRLGAVLRLSSVVVVILALVATVALATGQAGNMRLLVARAGHTATAQLDGSLVIAGGTGNRGVIKSLEFFDPVSGRSTPGPRLLEARSGHSAIALADGRVLLTGGRNGDNALLASSEIYDAAGGTLNPGASMGHARANHTSTLLADGRVLIAGGDAEGMAEIYDPATDRFVDTGRLAVARSGHSAVRLGDGRVLLVGGYDAAGATAEIFDPKTNTFSAVRGGLKTARVQPTLKLISDGKVQVYGGDAEITMEVYNPSGYFSSRGHLLRDSSMFRSIMYSPGQAALIAIPSAKAKHYAEDALGPAAGEFERTGYTATEVAARSTMVVVGGFGATGAALDTITELGSCGGTVTTDLTDYSPGQTVVMSGSGWAPGEQITLNLHRDTNEPPDTTLHATADDNGDWINAEYAVQESDLGVTFVLTATGDSGCSAQTTFTDTSLSYSPDPVSLTIAAGSSAHFTQTVTAPSGSGSFTAILQAAGAAGAWASVNPTSLSFTTTTTSASWVVTITVPSGTAAGTYTGQIKANPSSGSNVGVGNGTALSVIVTASTSPTTTVVTFDQSSPYTYTGSAFIAHAVVTGSGGFSQPVSVTYTGDCTNVTVANGCSASASFAGDTTHAPSSDSKSITIVKATSTTTVSCPLSVAYTGSAQAPCTASFTTSDNLSGTLTPTYSNNTNVGTATANASYAGDANHASSSDSKNFSITKATSTTTLTCSTSEVYTGSPLTPCTASYTTSDNLSGTLTPTYTSNTNVGTATANASYAGDANHASSSDSKNFSITKATSTTTLTCSTSVVYTGSAQTPCTASYTTSDNLSGTLTPTYTSNTNVGTATANASYAGDANHASSSDSKNFSITKATSTTTLTCPTSVVYTGSPLTPCTASYTTSDNLSGTLTPTYTSNTNVGTATANASYAGDANHASSSDSKNFSITKATSTTTLTCPTSVVYTGSAQTPCTASYTTSDNLSGTLTPTYTSNTNVGTATANASYAGDANHASSSDSKNFSITKATSTTTLTCSTSEVYTGSPLTPCTASYTTSDNLSGTLTPTYTSNTNVGTATASASYAGDANHASSSDSRTFSISQATSTTTVTCLPTVVAYTGSPQTPCTASFITSDGLGGTLTPMYSDNTNAGTATANASYAGDTNHAGSSDSKNFAISQATSTTTVSCPLGVAYTGSPQTPCTASYTTSDNLSGSSTVTYTNNTNVGTATANASYAGDTNHAGSNDSKNFAISQATSTTTVSCPLGVAYTGSPQTPCTASYTTSDNLSGTLTPTYSNNTNVGTATATATYAGDTNHASSSDTKHFTISQATSTTTVTCPASAVPYTGSAQELCTASYTTSDGGSGTLTPTYSNNTNVGTATASATYAGDTNHASSSDTKHFIISQATSTTTVNCPPSVTYTGLPQQTVCTASFSTSDGHSGTLTPTYSNNTNVGTATASAMYAGDANHFGSSNSASFAITPADALISVQGYGVTYNGASHAATGSATGVLGESLAGLDLGGTVHTAAGSYTDTWTFTDVTGNYNNATGTVNDVIGKADATIVVTPYDVPFDAMPHTATGTAKGVLGETLAGLNLSGTTHSAAGTYNDTWTFTDVTSNYKNTSGQVTDVIEACMAATSISSNFNGTSIAAGRYIWFNSNFSVSGSHTTPVAISFTDQTITSGYFSTPVPDSVVILDPAATTATTTFAGGMWTTRVPASGLAGNTLLSGAPYLVPAGGLRGGINPVTWSGVISTGTPGIKLNWAWGAAVYTSFSGDPGQVGVKPVDDNKASAYKNSDHAGTPESFKAFVTGGARGGGGSNFTGSWSGTDGVTPVCTQ